MTEGHESAFRIADLHLVGTVTVRGKEAWAAVRALDDALYALSGREMPDRLIVVDDTTGRISIDTPKGTP